MFDSEKLQQMSRDEYTAIQAIIIEPTEIITFN